MYLGKPENRVTISQICAVYKQEICAKNIQNIYAQICANNERKYAEICGKYAHIVGICGKSMRYAHLAKICGPEECLCKHAYKVTPKGTVTVTNITCMNTFAAEYELSE